MKDLIITLGGYEQIILNAQIYISYVKNFCMIHPYTM